jgi:threonylcarbamoyladenosine tRNA methylthiotransferase MtaB
MLKVSFHTFGCKTNVCDSESIAKKIVGMDIVESELAADIHIVNTCTVTSSSDAQARNLLRKLDKCNTGARIFVTGCYAKRKPQALLNLLDSLNKENRNKYVISDKAGLFDSEIGERENIYFRTRAFVKIGDGCDNFCSYCIIPLIRGKPWSRPVNDVVTEVKKMEENGIKELVLTSMCISSYEYGLANLLRSILESTKDIRIRLSSLRPSNISNELLMLMKSERLCPHLHISLQNGSDRILELMNRKDYKAGDFIEICGRAKDILRDRYPFIAADVIVGFPGETKKDFELTMDVLNKSKVDKLHVFVFSPRPGTAAASIKVKDIDGFNLGKQVQDFKKELLSLSDSRFKKFMNDMAGKELDVVWETDTKGHSDNYCPVKGHGKAGTRSRCRVVNFDRQYLTVKPC